jgi:hypothetical protein
MVLPLGTVPVTLAVSVIWDGCAWALATNASAAARPEPLLVPEPELALPVAAVVALVAPDEEVVAVLDDLELLLQAASIKATTAVPITENVARRRRFGALAGPAG